MTIVPVNVEGYARQVLGWDLSRSMENNLATMKGIVTAYNNLLGDDWRIDEVSIMAPDHTSARMVCFQATQHPSVQMFNAARDSVVMEPFGTRYEVEYMFLSTDLGFRVEVMSFSQEFQEIKGYSPLHHGMFRLAGQQSVELPFVHASFRCVDHLDMEVASRYLLAQGMHAATCHSTYGMFSYFMPQKSGVQVYLKPRLNMRDAR